MPLSLIPCWTLPAFPHLHSFKNQHFSRERRMRGIEIENENELWWVRHSLCSVFTTVPISLTEMLRKWVLPWKNYILSRPAAVTGLSQHTRDAASESCALEIPAFLWSGFSSAKKRSGSSSENKLTTHRDFPAFLHLARFPLFWMKPSLLRNNHTWCRFTTLNCWNALRF